MQGHDSADIRLARLSMLPLPLPEREALSALQESLACEESEGEVLISESVPSPLREDEPALFENISALMACVPCARDGFVLIPNDTEKGDAE